MPATQLTQLIAADDEVVPEAQLEHSAAPVDAMKVPLLQLVHELAPAAEYLPGEQLVQPKTVVPPVMAEYLPAKHEIHEAPPLMATYVPAEQLVHSLTPLAEYLPAAQLVHAVLPVELP